METQFFPAMLACLSAVQPGALHGLLTPGMKQQPVGRVLGGRDTSERRELGPLLSVKAVNSQGPRGLRAVYALVDGPAVCVGNPAGALKPSHIR